MNERDFDVIFIGAGISGIGAARQLKAKCADKEFVVLESKPSHGGTWHTHRYPGIRSDSDLYTFGYKSKPWTGKPIAQGDEIMRYLREAIHEGGIENNIRYEHELISANWLSDAQRWQLLVRHADTVEEYSCNFLLMCHGYYRHDKGYTPDFPGIDDYQGTLVHPQHWPEDLDYTGKRVIVIGSGATAATLVPKLAEKTSHVTMLQRSPTYFFTTENRNELVDSMRELELPEDWIHEAARRSMMKAQRELFGAALAHPEETRRQLLDAIRAYVGDDFDVEKHFSPRYQPGTQRIAFIPDGDLFKKIAEAKVTVVTDEIDRFNEAGILTKSGEQLDADIIVTATGFHMSLVGDIEFKVDGAPVDFANEFTYHGVLTSNVPNFTFMFGYLHSSWTMRVELQSELLCRLINHMTDNGYSSCTPTLRVSDKNMQTDPFIAPSQFNPGYTQRGIHLYPKQGDSMPWKFQIDYYIERGLFPTIDFRDDVLKFVSR